jgi:hypothetical protein
VGLKQKYEIIPISKQEAKELISAYHYLGKKGFRSGACYGLRDKDTWELVGAAVYHGVRLQKRL